MDYRVEENHTSTLFFFLKKGVRKDMKLVIAEKPSVALSIAKVLGANDKKDGYVEGNGYKVSWCVGHLIQMANPDAYDSRYVKWNMEDLPIFPKDYKYEVTKATKKQFSILKKLMNESSVDTIINACDAGREGEAIFRLVYTEASCKKKVKRLWISSMEDSARVQVPCCLSSGKSHCGLVGGHEYQQTVFLPLSAKLFRRTCSDTYPCHDCKTRR